MPYLYPPFIVRDSTVRGGDLIRGFHAYSIIGDEIEVDTPYETDLVSYTFAFGIRMTGWRVIGDVHADLFFYINDELWDVGLIDGEPGIHDKRFPGRDMVSGDTIKIAVQKRKDSTSHYFRGEVYLW